MNQLAKAISYAASVHSDQIDKGGQPYILHPIRVMQRSMDVVSQVEGWDPEAVGIAAVLHDVIEDSPGDPLDVLHGIEATYGKTVANWIWTLTRSKGEDYLESYIPRVKQQEVTTTIKLADLEDNLSILRQPTLKDKDLLRLQKYHIAYRMLRPW